MFYKIKRADGGVSIGNWGAHDPASQLAQWEQSAQPSWLPVVSCEAVSPDAIPNDRTFRDAWGHNGVDMAKARLIHRGRIRLARVPKFAALDGEWMKCTAAGDSAGAAAAEAKRQELRDAPAYPAIDAAATPEELKAAWPECLK